MTEGCTVDLVRLAEGKNGLRVQVLDRPMPGVLGWHDMIDRPRALSR